MAKTVNEKITDTVIQVNTKVLAGAPAMAMGQALANAAMNATAAQQQAAITAQAATVQGVNSLGTIGSAVLDQ